MKISTMNYCFETKIKQVHQNLRVCLRFVSCTRIIVAKQ